jgi:outer membrane protein
MDLSEEKRAAAPPVEHDEGVQTRTLLPVSTLLSFVVALSTGGQARAQASPPTQIPASPDAGTGPGSIAGSDVPRVLHLDEAVQTALKQQPQLLQAQANQGAAEGRVIETRSPLLPQINGVASYQRIHNAAGTLTSNTPGVTPSRGPSTYNSFNFGVTGNQLLWDFGQTWYSFRSSERLADSLRATTQATEIQVVLGVRTAFFQARGTRDLVKVAQETLDNQLKHQQQVEGFVRVGTQPEIDLAQARTNVANARVQLITAQNADRIAKAQLNQAIGLPQGTDYQVSDEDLPPVEGETGAISSLFDTALASRPELASLEFARQSREDLLASARGGWGPSISFSGGYAKAGPDIGALYDTWNFGFFLNWPLFQGGLTYGRVREAEQNLKSAAASLTLEQLQVRFDVEQAQATIIGNRESLVAAQDALVNARERLRLAEGRYQAGVGNIIELSDAQVAFTNAGAQLVVAKYNLSTGRAKLLAALGREQ